ncbi:Thaumatin-like protein 1 [Orobanche gracilis]
MGTSCLRILVLILINSYIAGVSASTFTFVNKCEFTVWPGILSNAGIAPFLSTGFALENGGSKVIDAPSSWRGRFWGRTACTKDSAGKFTCQTGDCGSGVLECNGGGAVPPATLAEFTLDGGGGKDFYDVSLVDGYNLPMLVVPQGGSGDNCTSTGCVVDLNGSCPPELRVTSEGQGVACKSACGAFGTEQYCCSGAYGTPDVCKPSQYSLLFKHACPRAYSYAYDDKTSTFTCTGADYVVTFCPSPNTSQKSSGGPNQGSDGSNSDSISPFDSNMVYEGAYETNTASSSTCTRVMGIATAVAAAIWQLDGHYLFY